jgi:hypothetical protein
MKANRKGYELKWGTPPAPARTLVDWDGLVSELKARPGAWARTFSGLFNSDAYRRRAQLLTKGCLADVRKGGKSEKGSQLFDVWASWPLDPEDPQEVSDEQQ